MGPAAVIGIQQMFSRERRAAIKQRAKVMGRMVMLLTDGLCTKSYDQFVESYSNPGDEPDETARNARISAIRDALLTDLLVRGNGIAVRERTTLDSHRGRWRRLWRCHKCARAGRCQHTFLSRSRFTCAAASEKGPRCRCNGPRIARHTRLETSRGNLSWRCLPTSLECWGMYWTFCSPCSPATFLCGCLKNYFDQTATVVAMVVAIF